MNNGLLTLALCFFTGISSLLAGGLNPESGVVSVDPPTIMMGQVEILNPDTIYLCLGDTVELMQTNNLNDAGLIWSPGEGFIDALTDPSPRVVPVNSRYYVVSVGAADSLASDSVYIDVDRFVVPELINDTLICQGYPLQLITNAIDDTGNTVYDWSPGDFLDDSTDVNAIFVSEVGQDTVFTLVSTSENGVCSDTQMVRVDLIRSSLDILAEDTIFRCLGDEPLVIEASVDPFVDNDVTWSPLTGALSNNQGPSYTVDHDDNLTYYVEGVVGGCFQIDSVYVRIDSLPDDMSLTLDPVKDPFCQGDTFTLRSPTYDVGDYPLITHEWIVAPGIASPQDLYNAVFFASDSALVQRVNESGGCGDTSFIQINVIQPPILVFNPADPVVCPGEPLQITASFAPGGPTGTLEWEDPMGTLSCDDCLDPIATVGQTTTYMITVTADGSDCTSPAEYSIQVGTDLTPDLTQDRLLCLGESRRLIVGGTVLGYTYRITGGGIDTNDPNVEVTPTETTTYTVETTGDCGVVSEDITLEIINDYTLTADGPGTVCGDEDISLTANLSNNRNGQYVWTLPGGTETRSGAQITVPAVSGTYSVVFTDDFGCGSATASTDVTVLADELNPEFIFTDVDGNPITETFPGNRVVMTAQNVDPALNPDYSWSGNVLPPTGTGESLEVQVPGISDNPPTSVAYTLTVSIDAGCEAEVFRTLAVGESRVVIPEVITPNGDGTNDNFRLFYGGEITDYTMTIFNRWGQKVFSSTDVDEGWDGTKNGSPQNADAYLYITKFRINGAEETLEGQFSLVR
ncbi:gliding motility-associated C-terminal domain-containing protein [Neolewinella agarilytica]|uniref:gliding motility-associated C-terminal domain-containing protein n=1 Tax=Neolewinella agarilytica TaxID=478744 RepID=UPI002355E8A6|nr:gliding motility-associated C-terminal domain-containing protein [Neolewinella agarilytica]